MGDGYAGACEDTVAWLLALLLLPDPTLGDRVCFSLPLKVEAISAKISSVEKLDASRFNSFLLSKDLVESTTSPLT